MAGGRGDADARRNGNGGRLGFKATHGGPIRRHDKSDSKRRGADFSTETAKTTRDYIRSRLTRAMPLRTTSSTMALPTTPVSPELTKRYHGAPATLGRTSRYGARWKRRRNCRWRKAGIIHQMGSWHIFGWVCSCKRRGWLGGCDSPSPYNRQPHGAGTVALLHLV